MTFVMVNEFDEDQIDLELGDDITANDCLYIEMDDEFPLINQQKESENYSRDYEIFKILKHCYKYGKPPNHNTSNKTESETISSPLNNTNAINVSSNKKTFASNDNNDIKF